MNNVLTKNIAGREMKVEFGKVGMLIRCSNIHELWRYSYFNKC